MNNGNQLGRFFRLTSFGESHGPAIGGVIDGCPAGVAIDKARIQNWLDRRRPGKLVETSSRSELDQIEILSGILEGATLGTPIAGVIRNQDTKSQDYSKIETAVASGQSLRKGHADDLWRDKFAHSDVRGGGRASGRETAVRVFAGSVAQQFVKSQEQAIRVGAYISSVGTEAIDKSSHISFQEKLATSIESDFVSDSYDLRCPDKKLSSTLSDKFLKAKEQGESYGGTVDLLILNSPKGLGSPVFSKFKTDLTSLLMSLGTVIGVEFVDTQDFDLAHTLVKKRGSEFHQTGSAVYSGLRGGITTGEPIHVRIYCKPVSTIGDLAKLGRHDPCVLPRIVPVVEASAWFVLADAMLAKRLDRV